MRLERLEDPFDCIDRRRRRHTTLKGRATALREKQRDEERGRCHVDFLVAASQSLLPHGGGAEHAAHAHRLHGAARHEHQRSFFLEAFVEHVHRPQVQRSRVVAIRLRGALEALRDLDLRLAQDDARLLLARGLRLARHRVLQRHRNHDVTHLDRLHRHTPRRRPFVDELLELRLDPLTAAEQIGQGRAPDDVAERRLGGPTHGLPVVLHFERRLFRVVHHPEKHRVDIDRNGVGRQRLLRGEARRDHPLIDPRSPHRPRGARSRRAPDLEDRCSVRAGGRCRAPTVSPLSATST